MLIRWWKQQLADQLVGLDIGSESIKLLKIDTSRQPYRVEHFAIVEMPSGVTVTEKDYPVISAMLDNLFKHADTKVDQIALAIPRSTVIIKNMTVDGRLSSSEIESRVWVEANRYFPDLIGEIYLDYISLGQSTNNPQQIDIMLVACRKDQIKPYLEVSQMAGLRPKVVDVNSYALERALNVILATSPQLKTVALLNLDASLSSFIVSDDRNLIFTHDQSFNGKILISELQEYLGNADKQPADPTIQKASLQDETYVTLLKNKLIVHIKHGLHFFYSSRPAIAIQQIVLSGDLAIYPEMGAFIQQEVNIETVTADPFAHMEINPGVDVKELKHYAPALMVCCGLALSKLKRSTDIKKIEITGDTNGSN